MIRGASCCSSSGYWFADRERCAHGNGWAYGTMAAESEISYEEDGSATWFQDSNRPRKQPRGNRPMLRGHGRTTTTAKRSSNICRTSRTPGEERLFAGLSGSGRENSCRSRLSFFGIIILRMLPLCG